MISINRIFQGSELWQKITGLGLITCLTIGDIFNYGRNALVVICGDGWVHVFYSPRPVNPGVASMGSLGLVPNLKESALLEQGNPSAGRLLIINCITFLDFLNRHVVYGMLKYSRMIVFWKKFCLISNKF